MRCLSLTKSANIHPGYAIELAPSLPCLAVLTDQPLCKHFRRSSFKIIHHSTPASSIHPPPSTPSHATRNLQLSSTSSLCLVSRLFISISFGISASSYLAGSQHLSTSTVSSACASRPLISTFAAPPFPSDHPTSSKSTLSTFSSQTPQYRMRFKHSTSNRLLQAVPTRSQHRRSHPEILVTRLPILEV